LHLNKIGWQTTSSSLYLYGKLVNNGHIMDFVKTTVEKAKAAGRTLRMDQELQEMITANLNDLEEGDAWEITLSPTEKAKRSAIKGQIERIATLNHLQVAVRTSG